MALAGGEARHLPIHRRFRHQDFGQAGAGFLRVPEVLADVLAPPAAFRRKVAQMAPPYGRGHRLARHRLGACMAFVRIKIGNGAQQHRFPRARRAGDRQRLAIRHRKADGADMEALQILNFEHASPVAVSRHHGAFAPHRQGGRISGFTNGAPAPMKPA